MRITAGPAIYCESYGKFASEFSTKNSTNNLTPAQVFAKYNVKDMSNIDQSHMLLDLWSSSDPESGYVGMNMGFDIMEHNIVNSLNGVTESPTQRYNLLSSAEDSYKKEISGGGAAANYYLKLCQYLSQAGGQMAG
jgi:hypothetical protein